MSNKIPNTPFSTHLSGSVKETELRLRSIFQWKKKRPPVVVFALAILAVVFCGGLIAFEPDYELIPNDAEALDALELSDSLVYADGSGRSRFNLYWVREEQEPVWLCQFFHWGRSAVELDKVQLGQQSYLTVQYESHYPDAFYWNYKKFTNFFYLPEEGAPVFALQVEGDYYFKDLSGDGAKEIVHYKKHHNDIEDVYYTSASDGRLMKTNQQGTLAVEEEISEEILERLYNGNYSAGANYAAPLMRKYEGVVLMFHEDSLSVLTKEWKELLS